jgi:hypothetical protein
LFRLRMVSNLPLFFAYLLLTWEFFGEGKVVFPTAMIQVSDEDIKTKGKDVVICS